MSAHLFAITIILCVCAPDAFAQESPCAAPETFNGYWGGGQLQVREHVAGIPLLATARFSYRQIRYSPCGSGIPIFPPGIGEASISMGVPLFNNRRGGWLLQIGAHGQGWRKPSESTSGVVTGAPAMAGHVNLWETPLPLVQFTGAVSTVIMPQSGDVPLSISYIGGARVYTLYAKRAQANLGFMIGGSNGGMNIVPSFALRFSDLPVWGKRLAIGFEVRSPMTVDAGPLPVRWRLWGAFSFILEKLDESKNDRVHAAQPNPGTFDLVQSPPQAAPLTQAAWEMTL